MNAQRLENNIKHFITTHQVLIFSVLAGLFFLIMLVQLTMAITQDYRSRGTSSTPQKTVPIKSNTTRLNINNVVSANLFGKPKLIKTAATKAPKTTLNLVLNGVLEDHSGQMARALISVGKNKPGLYSVGEKLDKVNAKIEHIKRNEVLLNRNGAIESLPLIKKKPSSSNGTRSRTTFNNNTPKNRNRTTQRNRQPRQGNSTNQRRSPTPIDNLKEKPFELNQRMPKPMIKPNGEPFEQR